MVVDTGQAPRGDQVFGGVRWVAIGQLISQVVRLAVSVTLARLLSPRDFGLLSMAAVFSAIGWMLSTLGIGPALVQRSSLPEALLRSLATLGLVVGFALWGVLALASGAIARFFGEPALAPIVASLGGTFAFAAFGMVPDGLLQRGLRFDRLVAIDLTVLGIHSLSSLGLAVLGFGVWALVVPNLIAPAVRSALLILSSPWRLRLGFSPAMLRGIVGYSGSILGFNALIYLVRNVDRAIIGRALGTVQVGLYDYAYRFFSYPLEVITGVLIQVMLPTFSRLQADRHALGRTFLRANGAIALVTFPMMAGLGAVARPFVRVVLGERWEGVIPLLQVLAPLGALQSISATCGQVFLATGNAALRLGWASIYTTVIIGSYFAGLPWGIFGVTVAYGIAMVPITWIGFWLALRLVDFPMSALGKTLGSTLAAALAMALLVAGLEAILARSGTVEPLVLGLCVAAGIASYAALIWWLRPEALDDLIRLLPPRLRVLVRGDV